MDQNPIRLVEKKVEKIFSPFEAFVQSQASTSIALAISTVLALFIANSDWHDSYQKLLHIETGFVFDSETIKMGIKEWVGSGLMALFFFLLGLELKREIIAGELKGAKRVGMVLMAALGGMLLPAVFYLIFNSGSSFKNGWAIPLATDTAFAIGLLGFFSRRVNNNLFIYLTGIAIFDDLGAIGIIAVYYSESLNFTAINMALVFLLLLLVANVTGVRRGSVYLILGIILWWYVHQSGVHGTMAGILVALAIPARPNIKPSRFAPQVKRLASDLEKRHKNYGNVLEDGDQFELVSKIEDKAQAAGTPLQRWETLLENPIGLIILPLFALCNAGIRLADHSLGDTLTSPLVLGIISGLVVGKPAGVFLFSWIAVKLKLGELPEGVSFKEITGVGFLAGIGFTMSIFISILAFPINTQWVEQAKLAILLATLISGILSFFWFFVICKKQS